MTVREIESIFVNPDATIHNTIEILDKNGKGIALVINENRKLIGTITDGDIRRAILRGGSLNEKNNKIMNTNFTFVTKGYSKVLIQNLFNTKPIKQIPVVNDDMEVVDVIFHHEFYYRPLKDNCAIIMAGGLGTRLRPLTYDLPKPMLKVGAKPILETIIDQLKSYGFINILISVNYKSEIIENYFKDGDHLGVKITYIRENKRLGTGGAVKLAKEYLYKPFFLVNGDILTKLNFIQFMEFHNINNNDITVGTRQYEFKIPYGILEIDKEKVISLKEKPVYNYFINTGLYVINPEVINNIPENTFFNITDLIENRSGNISIGSFPIREYWSDIGQINDYQQANIEYYQIFEDEKNATAE